ncbi:MAG: cation transporter dimerization domain-containing protein, partial [Nitrososphaera sp.]
MKDGIASFMGFGSILAGYFGIPYMDSVGSLIIAGYIFLMAYTAFKESALVLVDAVRNPELQLTISNHIEKKFNARVEKILIRPVGRGFSAQIHVELDRSMTLENVHEILTKIRKSVLEDLKADDAVIIPKPV